MPPYKDSSQEPRQRPDGTMRPTQVPDKNLN